MSSLPTAIYNYIDSHQKEYVDRLTQAVKIPSVSADTTSAGRQHVIDMSNFMLQQLKALNVDARQVELGPQSGTNVNLPPLVIGTLGTDPKKKTVLIYGHFDVQPAQKSDGWNTDPFTLTEVPDGKGGTKMVGRGSTDDKGPILGWVNCIEAYQQSGVEIPVNIKFLFEGMEEQSSDGLNDYIKQEANGYFKGVNYVTICDNYWLNNKTPVLTYGLRGIAMYRIDVNGAPMNLHSGIYGGMIFEPMSDLIAVLASLVNNQAQILIPSVNNLVPPPTAQEIELYQAIDYSVQDLNEATQADVGLSSDKVTLLMGRMRFPTLTIHEITNGSPPSDPNVAASTVIPHAVSAKFSMRLVPDQSPDVITGLLREFIECEFKKLKTKNTYNFTPLGETARPWVASFDGPSYKAADDATFAVYGMRPNYDREGGSIGVAITLADAFGNDNVLLLPMGRGDDNPHAPNEKLDQFNYFNGTKVMATYLWNLAKETSG
ncbi:hypothetical protein VKT23_008621 [Stygiomarasmius scandens]|uniref:Peptidase M20 dimerisation domain-containing protein n=1 Tax=Marasmiellus scandens TaxID=2682957 RepID=A0ABR1JL78_9AGAR